MALNIGDNFKYQGKKPNFERDSFATKAEMKGFPEANVDEGHISFCEEDGKHYEFKAGNSVDTNTGKWREFTTNVDLSGYATKTEVQQSVANKVDKSYVDGKVDVKQDKLADGINIKTINGQPIMGKGNITIAGPDGQLDLSGYATKTEMLNNITDYNVSKHHPTEGIGGTNKFTLETAIKLIPESLRSVGIKCSFLDNADNAVKTFVYQGGTFSSADSWKINYYGSSSHNNQLDNSVCVYGSIIFNKNEDDKTYSVSLQGDRHLFSRGKYVCAVNGTLDNVSDYFFIYTNKTSKTLQFGKHPDFKASNEDIILCAGYISGGIFKPKDLVYSAFNRVSIDGTDYDQFSNSSISIIDPGHAENIKWMNAKQNALILNQNALKFTFSDSKKILKIGVNGQLQLFFSDGVKGNANGYIYLPNYSQEIDINSIIGVKDYVRLMFDIEAKKFILRGYASYSSDDYKNYLQIGFFYIESKHIQGFLINSQTYVVNGNEVLGNGSIYSFDKLYSPIKFAQIGDSITYLYDNKWEYSWNELEYAAEHPEVADKTGYKNESGYGALLARKMNIAYENHYPQGLNGRTFCDYIDEWEKFAKKYKDFPKGIDVWTIFLGTNDWGTERHKLGSKDDYLNNTYSSSNRTTYGAIRKIVDKIRSLNDGKKTPRIIFITPMQRGAFAYGKPLGNFMKSAIRKSVSGQWEYAQNKFGFTLKDVVDSIKWVCDYESFQCIDLFNESIVDKNYLNCAQTLSEIDESNWIYQDVLYDNLHPTVPHGTTLIASRLFKEMADSLTSNLL